MDDNSSEKESSGLLANALFHKGLQRVFDYHRKVAEQKRAEGNLEVAEEHDKRAMTALNNANLLKPAPNLSEEENVKYLKLLNKRFSIGEDGDVDEMEVSVDEKKELDDLLDKGFPDYKPKKD